MRPSEEERRRAADYVLLHMEQRGWDVARLRVESGLDAGTIRTFLAGETWPQVAKRQAIEDAFGWNHGHLLVAARGLRQTEETGSDPVERAIRQSSLNRANQHKLIGAYYEMLDQQGEVRAG